MDFNVSDGVFISLWRSAATVFGLVSVTYTGIEVVVSSARDYIVGALGSVSGDAACFLGQLGVDHAVNLIFAGISVRMSLGIWRRIIPG